MLRKLIVIGAIAGGSASLPAIYERNPDLFRSLSGRTVEPPAPAAKTPVVMQAARQEKAPVSGRKVTLEADARGHFRADFRINGRPLDALVDTGATMIAINRTTARQIGIPLSPADFRHEVNTANGTIKAAAAMLASVQIGRILVRDVEAMVLEDKALSGTLVGMSFLRRLQGFRVDNGRLLLEQ